jgi:lipopolysaccharide export system protein LptC
MSIRANPAATLFPLLLVGLLAGMSYWLELASRAPEGANDGRSRHDPDYIIKNFEVRRFDPQGNLQHTVVADLMRHYPDDDSTVVLAPRITYHRDPPTFIQAREAHVSSKGEHVRLIDDVRVTRGGVRGKPDTVLTTALLDAWPEEETAKSNVPVTIAQGQTKVQGSGLSVDNKTSVYILEGPVKGVFFRKANAATAVPVTPPAVVKAAKTSPAKPQSKSGKKPPNRLNAAKKPNATR